MENCPTRSEFAVLVIRPENQELIDLYRANEKLYAVITQIMIDAGLDQLQLKVERGFLQQGHQSDGKVTKTDHELCRLMVSCKKHKACICSKILEETELNTPEFGNVIVSRIQGLTRNGIKGRGHEKEVNLSLNNVGTYSVEWEGIARNSEGIVLVVGVLNDTLQRMPL
jgi:hypothetical protein